MDCSSISVHRNWIITGWCEKKTSGQLPPEPVLFNYPVYPAHPCSILFCSESSAPPDVNSRSGSLNMDRQDAQDKLEQPPHPVYPAHPCSILFFSESSAPPDVNSRSGSLNMDIQDAQDKLEQPPILSILPIHVRFSSDSGSHPHLRFFWLRVTNPLGQMLLFQIQADLIVCRLRNLRKTVQHA